MATIDNLNFKIILDDKAFNKTVSSVLQTAKALNTQLSNLLQVSAKASTAIATSKSKGQTAELKKQTAELKKQTAELNKQTAVRRTHNSQMKEQGALLSKIKGFAAGYLSVAGATAFLRSLTSITGEFEKQHVALRSILQDSAGADALFERLKTLAVKSPFQFGQLVSYSKQLSAFAVPLDELYDKTKMLADLSAGLGVDMYRLVLAYGQVRSASYLRGQELRQFTEAGVPILQELANEFEKLEGHIISTGDVFDRVSKRQVSFEMVDKVLTNLTSEGGRFYQMQEVLAGTLAGKISNLTDAYQIMMSEIGNANGGVLKGAVTLLTEMMNNYKDVGEAVLALVATYGIYRATMAVTNAVIAAQSSGLLGSTTAARLFNRAMLQAAKGARALSAALSKNVWGLVAAGAAAAAYAIYKAVTAMSDYDKMQKVVTDSVDEYTAELATETNTLKVLFGELEAAEKGTERYENAKKQVMSQFGTYLSDLEREQIALGDLGAAYDSLSAKIENTMKLRAAENSIGELKSLWEGQQQDLLNKARKKLPKNLSDGEVQVALKILTGTIGLDNEELSDKIRSAVESLWYVAPQKEYTDMGELIEEVPGVSYIDKLRELKEQYDEQVKIILTTFDGEKAAKDVWQPAKDWQKTVYEYLQSLGVDTTDADAAKAALARLGDNLNSLWVDENTISTDDWVKTFRSGYKELLDRLPNTEIDPSETARIKQSMTYYQQLAEVLGLSLEEEKEEKTDSESLAKAATKRAEDEAKAIAEAEAKLEEIRRKREEMAQELLLAAKEEEVEALPEGTEKKQAKSALSFVKEMMEHGLWGDEWKAALEYLNGIGTVQLSTDTQVSKMAQEFIDTLADQLYQEWRVQNPGASASERKRMELEIATALNTDSLPEDIRTILEAYSTAATDIYLREQADNLKTLLQEYADYAAKRQQIDEDYAKAVADIEAQTGNFAPEQIQSMKDEATKQRDKSLGDLLLEEEEALGTIFTDTAAMTTTMLQAAVNKARVLKNSLAGSTDVESYEKVAKRLSELEDTLYDREHFSLLGNYSPGTGIQDVARAVGDLIREQRKLAKLKEKTTATDETDSKIITEQENKVAAMQQTLAQTLANKGVNTFLGGLREAASCLQEIADISGDDDLANVGEVLSTAADALESWLSAFASSGNWIVALATTAASLVDSMISSFTEAAVFAAELKAAAQEYANACKILEVTFDESEYESMFGTNALREAIDAYSTAQAAASKFSSALTDVINSQVKVKKGTWFTSAQYENLGAYAASLGYSLWDNGEFDYDRAQEFLDAYGDILPTATREALEYAIELEEAYEDAMEVVEEYWSDIFGDLADDLTDILADAIDSGSDAWTDFQEKGAEVIKSLAETMISTMLYENYLEPYIDQLTSVLGSSSNITEVTESAAAIIAQMFSGLEDGLTYAQSLYEYMEELSANLGYDWDTTSSSDLSSGIESVTEETASLLASYINAIRADVSQQNDYMAAISTTLAGIDWSWAPNLNDYMAAVQAYLSDIALSTQSTADYTANVVTQLKKVISSETGSAAIRVAVQ